VTADVDPIRAEVRLIVGADTGMGSIVEPAYGVPVGVEPQSTIPAGVGGMELRPPERMVAILAPAGVPNGI